MMEYKPMGLRVLHRIMKYFYSQPVCRSPHVTNIASLVKNIPNAISGWQSRFILYVLFIFVIDVFVYTVHVCQVHILMGPSNKTVYWAWFWFEVLDILMSYYKLSVQVWIWMFIMCVGAVWLNKLNTIPNHERLFEELWGQHFLIKSKQSGLLSIEIQTGVNFPILVFMAPYYNISHCICS